ncbi:hypothetical protein V6N13_064423 [Hibiscus sabdariffa]
MSILVWSIQKDLKWKNLRPSGRRSHPRGYLRSIRIYHRPKRRHLPEGLPQDVEKHEIGVFGNFDFLGQKVNADISKVNAGVSKVNAEVNSPLVRFWVGSVRFVDRFRQFSVLGLAWGWGPVTGGRSMAGAVHGSHAWPLGAEKHSKRRKSTQKSLINPEINLPWPKTAPNATVGQKTESLTRYSDEGSNGGESVTRRLSSTCRNTGSLEPTAVSRGDAGRTTNRPKTYGFPAKLSTGFHD